MEAFCMVWDFPPLQCEKKERLWHQAEAGFGGIWIGDDYGGRWGEKRSGQKRDWGMRGGASSEFFFHCATWWEVWEYKIKFRCRDREATNWDFAPSWGGFKCKYVGESSSISIEVFAPFPRNVLTPYIFSIYFSCHRRHHFTVCT